MQYPRLNEVRSWRPEQWLASGGGPDKGLYQCLRALRPADPCFATLLSCHRVKRLVKPLRELPRGCDTTTGLAVAHTTTGPSSGTLCGTPSITVLAGGVGASGSFICVHETRASASGRRRSRRGCRGIGQKVVTPSRFMKAPWPVSLFQQVSPFSSEAHT